MLLRLTRTALCMLATTLPLAALAGGLSLLAGPTQALADAWDYAGDGGWGRRPDRHSPASGTWAAVQRARLEYYRDRRMLDRIHRTARRDFEQTPEYKQAVGNLLAARQEFEAVRDPIRSTLAGQDDYRALWERKLTAERALDDLHRARKPDQAKIDAAAAELLAIRQQLTDHERGAMKDNDALATARLGLSQAGGQVRGMSNEFNASVKTVPAWADAREQLLASRRRVVEAESALERQLKAEAAATNARNTAIVMNLN